MSSGALKLQPSNGLQSRERLRQPLRLHQSTLRTLAPCSLPLASARHRRLPHNASQHQRTPGWRGAAAAAHHYDAFDPDTYCEEPEDPDDYSFGEYAAGPATSSTNGSRPPAAAAVEQAAGGGPGSAAKGSSSTSSVASAAGEMSRDQQPGWRKGNSALDRGYTLVLLFAAAMARLLSRLQTAVLATGRVAWQLGGDALRSLRRNAVKTRDQAAKSLAASPAAKRVEKWQKKLEAVQHELPEDLWGKLMWLWDRPDVQKLRLTISMANFSIRLPALVALVATQIGLLSTSLSLPMLAPLLLGTGMLLRSIRTNASLVFPRIGLLVVLLWLLWFANSVIQNTVAYLRKQGAIDQRLANNINSAAELAVLLTAGIILLSMLGVNVSALLLPAGVALAFAAKDLSHNFLAGFFLMMVQPFRLGDRVGVTLPAGASPGPYSGVVGPWFEGVCEKVDLRYTSLRSGKRRLMVPNSAFLQQPFMILEDAPAGTPPDAPLPAAAAAAAGAQGGAGGAAPTYQPFVTRDGRHIWQAYVNGAPVHQELAQEAAPTAAAAAGSVVAGPPAAQPAPGMQHPQQQQQQQQQWPPASPGQQQQQQSAAGMEQQGQQDAQQLAGGSPHASAQQQQAGGMGPSSLAHGQQQQQQQQQQGTGLPHDSQQQQQQQHPVFYSAAPPPGGYPGMPGPPGSHPGMRPPTGYPLYPTSHPLPPHTLM